jgi:hypothetical protein
MTVQSGKSCRGRQWYFFESAGMSGKGLFLKAAPHHGKVVLTFPATYRYIPAAGYVGDDAFTLRVCGNSADGRESCADLAFSVNVVAGSI